MIQLPLISRRTGLWLCKAVLRIRIDGLMISSGGIGNVVVVVVVVVDVVVVEEMGQPS